MRHGTELTSLEKYVFDNCFPSLYPDKSEHAIRCPARVPTLRGEALLGLRCGEWRRPPVRCHVAGAAEGTVTNRVDQLLIHHGTWL